MFEIGEYVSCGSKGICVVEQITKLNLSGVDKERDYYILKSAYRAGSTIYIPVDSPVESIRSVLKKEEAQKLVDSIAQFPLMELPNEKFVEQAFKERMKTNRCEDWAVVLKTTIFRKNKRLLEHRKMTAVDTKYSHLAEDSLYGELAIALEMEREDVEKYLEEKKCFTFQEKSTMM